MKSRITINFREINHVLITKKLIEEHPEIKISMGIFINELMNNVTKYCKKNRMIIEINNDMDFDE